MIIIYRGPNALEGPGPELWVPEKTAYLPEQSFVATGWRSRQGVCGIVGDGLTGLRSRCEVWNCDGLRCDGPTLDESCVRCEEQSPQHLAHLSAVSQIVYIDLTTEIHAPGSLITPRAPGMQTIILRVVTVLCFKSVTPGTWAPNYDVRVKKRHSGKCTSTLL